MALFPYSGYYCVTLTVIALSWLLLWWSFLTDFLCPLFDHGLVFLLRLCMNEFSILIATLYHGTKFPSPNYMLKPGIEQFISQSFPIFRSMVVVPRLVICFNYLQMHHCTDYLSILLGFWICSIMHAFECSSSFTSLTCRGLNIYIEN